LHRHHPHLHPFPTRRSSDLHTSGLTEGAIGSNPVKQSYLDMKVNATDQTNAQMAEKLAKLALLYQPGTRWEYSMSTDVLGRVIRSEEHTSELQSLRHLVCRL